MSQQKAKVYWYGFYRIKGKKMEIVVTYGLREGLKWQCKGFNLCCWGHSKELAGVVVRQIAKEKGYTIELATGE